MAYLGWPGLIPLSSKSTNFNPISIGCQNCRPTSVTGFLLSSPAPALLLLSLDDLRFASSSLAYMYYPGPSKETLANLPQVGCRCWTCTKNRVSVIIMLLFDIKTLTKDISIETLGTSSRPDVACMAVNGPRSPEVNWIA